MSTVIQPLPLERLRVHPLNASLPAYADDDPRFLELCASVQECGEVLVPLIADGDLQVVDGAHRLRAARRVGLATVPVLVKPDAEVATLIVTTLVDRKHYSKGAMAYICAPLFDRMFAEGKARRAASARPAPLPKTADVLAERLGIGHRLVFQARELHKLFAQDPEFKAHMEPRILAAEDAVGLGAAIAGHAGWKATAGKLKADKRDAEQLWLKNFTGLCFQTARLPEVKLLAPKIREELAACEDREELARLAKVGQTISAAARRRLSELAKPQ